MKKLVYWIIWSLVVITINIGAIPIAAFSLFGTAEGTSIFSVDYLIAFLIVVVANIVTVQLFIAIRNDNKNAFLIGLIIAILQITAIILLINTVSATLCIILAVVSIISAMILLIWTVRNK